MGDEVANLKNKVADLTTKNAGLVEQLKNALEGKVEDVQEFMSKLSLQDQADKVKELTAENEKLQGIVQGLKDKIQGFAALAGGAQAGALGQDAAAKAGAEAQDQTEEAAEKAAAEANKAAAEAQEKAEEAAAAAASAGLTGGFSW